MFLTVKSTEVRPTSPQCPSLHDEGYDLEHTQQKRSPSSSPLYGTTATAAMTLYPGTWVLLILMYEQAADV